MNTQFIAYVFQKYFTENFMLKGEKQKCEDDKNHSEAEKPLCNFTELCNYETVDFLALMSTFGIFLIFSICIGASGIFFIMEKSYFYWTRTRKTRNEKKPDTQRISVVNDTIC